MRGWLAAILVGSVLAPPLQAAVQIDGVIAAGEWDGALRFDSFVAVQPMSGAPAPQDRRAEAYLLSTPEGLAFAVRAWHPPGVPRTRARIGRDGDTPVDRINVMLDFDADGRQGYDFMVTFAGDIGDEIIRNENAFNTDWDGAWEHAVGADGEVDVVELRIPWSIAPMRGSDAATRTIGVYVDRVIVASGERFAFPDASFQRPRFVSDFHRVEVAQYRQGELAVTPYAVLSHDRVDGGSAFKKGGDLFWKPSGDHQFALTVNPDFGQVESDELVVNFSAVETFFTDKRPFFTENQGYFDLQHDLGTLFYTRRVGAALDDGSGAADIEAAVKANGSVGDFGYGVFAASEDGAAGRDMHLLRTTHRSTTLQLGLTRSEVERPFLDRQATVTAVDAVWQPDTRWNVRPLLIRSDIDEAGARSEGHAAGAIVDWDMPGPWRQQYFWLYADGEVELNDLGFQERNDYRYVEWETGYRDDALPADSRFASHAWDFELAQKRNTAGALLQRTATVERYSQLRNGGELYTSLRWQADSVDDLLSRGNGDVPIRGGGQAYLEGSVPRHGDGRLAWYWEAEIFPDGLGGHSQYAGVQPRWHVGDRFDVDLGLYWVNRGNWLLWREGREFGRYRAHQAEIYSNLNWFIGERQELRIKLQAIGIDAEARQALHLDAAERLVDSESALADFQLRNLGFQLRWRYKLGVLSDVYAVYSRGGYAVDELAAGQTRNIGHVLDDAFALRDDDQLLLKVAYRFAL